MAESIGFIGLGQMGSAMAANLLSAGFAVRVYNRTPERAKPLVDRGAILTASPEQTATPGGIVVSIVSDDRALEAISTDALASALGKGGVHLSMSTVSPETTRRLAPIFASHGATLIAAPVFGRPEAAAARKLWICASGPAGAKQRVRHVFDAMGQGVFDFGEEVGAANVVKLAGNFLLTAAIEAMAEASVLAEKNGVSREALLEMFTQTLFNCPIYVNYSRRLIDADFDRVGFPIPLALKDMRLARDMASASNAPLPILSLLCDRYVSALAKGRANMDASAIALGAVDDANLKWD
ncbi:MAG TPA: NAD(P)-dependent oxidoreductase [Humisphaera sp.]|jgi:3-hydroxyisobutyrate dehydrogenase-like beta-hydroxyacid dehydrogenase|nr:NAD(P)-dependent oxidoreductase [Humisphaera sp.]